MQVTLSQTSMGISSSKPKKGRAKVKRQKNGGKIEIYDCAGYWQTSFLQALTTWEIGTSEERATIQQWKAQRNEFTLPLSDDVVAYNVLECRLLAQLMTRLDGVAEGLEIHQTRYFGAGALAEALLDKHNVAQYLGDPASRCGELVHAINCAYFGGRFESAVVGIVPELHVWDIASAYPAAMASLPCLRDGSWVYHDGVHRLDALSPATIVFYGTMSFRRFLVFPAQRNPASQPLCVRSGTPVGGARDSFITCDTQFVDRALNPPGGLAVVRCTASASLDFSRTPLAWAIAWAPTISAVAEAIPPPFRQ